tara:strand:- start:573 stop:905 length:333 start_codon:yes stop_codon:yes gene_type:complete
MSFSAQFSVYPLVVGVILALVCGNSVGPVLGIYLLCTVLGVVARKISFHSLKADVKALSKGTAPDEQGTVKLVGRDARMAGISMSFHFVVVALASLGLWVGVLGMAVFGI